MDEGDTFDESFDELEALTQYESQQYCPPMDQEEEPPVLSPATQANESNYNCKVCAYQCRGLSEYLKHLSKIHFKHKLLSMVPTTSPYKCPWQGCEMVKKDRFSISLHYGVTHKVALKLMQDMPEDALKEIIEVVCKLCQQSFTAHRYLYTHLSDSHFHAELDQELPSQSPWKCPKCPYLGNDLRALRVHFGVRHKAVLNHLANKLGVSAHSLKKEMKKTKKTNKLPVPASAQQQQQQQLQQQKQQQPKNQPQQMTMCRFCSMQMSETDHAKHIVMHLKTVLSTQLPYAEPFKCPKCDLVTNQHISLVLHYGTQHPEVVNELLGGDISQLTIDMNLVQPNQQSQQIEQAKQILEDKRFPKCRLCNYRYFTRLDLCRHFVDYHLRQRLSNCIDSQNLQCPACPLK